MVPIRRAALVIWGTALWIAGMAIAGTMALAEEKAEVFVQTGHSSSITSVAFSPDGKYVLSGSKDQVAILWDVATGRQVRSFEGHSRAVSSVYFSPDRRHVLSISTEDSSLKLWELTGREVRTFEQIFQPWCAAFSPDGQYVVSRDHKNLNVWELSTGKKVMVLEGRSSAASALVFSPGSGHLLAATEGTVGVWDLPTGKEVSAITLRESPKTAYPMAFSPDGRYLLAASEDKTAHLWEVSSGRKLAVLSGHEWRVTSVAFSPDGRYALSGSEDNTARIWEVSSGKEVKKLEGHKWFVTSVAFSPDGRYVASGSFDQTVKVWDASTGRELRTLSGHDEYVFAVALSPNGRFALSGGSHKVIKVWDIAGAREVMRLKGHEDDVKSLAFSPDSKYALSGSRDTTSKMWDLSTGKELITQKWERAEVASVTFTPDGRYALTGSFGGTVVLWEIPGGMEVSRFRALSARGIERITSVALTSDGRYALLGTMEQSLKLFEVATGKELRTFQDYETTRSEIGAAIHSVAISPDGRYALSGSMAGTVKLWEIATGRELRALKMHSTYVNSLAFSPDGRYALSGSYDGAKYWEVSTGREVSRLMGHARGIRSVAFSPDGRYALTGSVDYPTKIWEVRTGREICTLMGFDDGEWIVITAEGYFNCSPNGAKHLNVRIGNSVFGIDQFYAKFYRPELVQLALAGKEIPRGESLGDILAKKPAPLVQIVSPVPGTSVDTDRITLSLKVIDHGGGIGNVTIYLNGSQVANETRGVIIQGKESLKEKNLSFTIPLIDGQNEIRVIAFNKENSMESTPAVLSVISRAILQKPNLYGLVVGINQYRNKSISLTYAVADAMAFAETLKKTAAPLFGKTEVRVLTTPEATTKEAMIKAFEELAMKIKPNDLFVFYDASHGLVDVVDDEEQYFLLTSNVLLLSSRHMTEAISHKELAKLIGNIPAQKKIVILDTCNAGKGGKEIQVALLKQTRGLTDATAVKLLQRAIGSAVFSASSDTQLALEGYNGHGLFTYVLLEGLQGKADIKKDGYITVLGLADYVEEQVTKLSEEIFKRQQTPTIQTGANFPIGKVR